MRAFLAIVRREFLAYFVSPLAYVVLTAFLLANGIVFFGILQALNSPGTPRNGFMALFFSNIFFWIFMLLVPSIIAMRLISEERKSGSIEALLTAPIGEATVIAGKFVGAWCFFLFLWVPTFLYPILLSRYAAVDLGAIAGGYLGTFLIGGVFISLGTFASALSKNQIVAAIIGFGLILCLFLVGVFSDYLPASVKDVVSYMNLLDHMNDFSRGIVDTRRLVYFVSTTVFALFLSTKALEANKGR